MISMPPLRPKCAQRNRGEARWPLAAHGQRLRGLEVTRRFYSKAVGPTPPVPAERSGRPAPPAGRTRQGPPDADRAAQARGVTVLATAAETLKQAVSRPAG
jgi:hypothetical protein